MNTIKITTELSKKDREILEGLTGSITLLASVLGNMQPAAVQQQIIQEVTGSDHPADASTTHLEPVEETPVPTPADEPPFDVTPVSFAEFQKAVTQVVAKGAKQKAAAREIINKYAASVSEVPEEKRAEVMAELAKI